MSSPLYCQINVTRKRPDFKSPLLQYANRNRNKGYFDDITIEVGKDNFSANRMVLSCYSKFFEKKFQINETFHESVSIKNIDEESVKTVIDFIYSGKIIVNQDNVIKLLNAGHNLKVLDLEDYCFEYLESIINSENCFYILEVADRYQNDSLKSKVYLHMCENIVTMIQKLKFKQLSIQNIVHIVTTLNQNQFGNMTLPYEVILTWTKHDEITRKLFFPELFQSLDIDEIPKGFLKNVVFQEPLVRGNAACQELVTAKLFNYVITKFNKSSIICVGGWYTRSKVKEVYNLSGETPKQYPDLPMRLVRPCSLELNKRIVCFGGDVNGNFKPTNQVWKMELIRDELQWNEIVSMYNKRCNFGAAIFQDCVVVAGGYGGKYYLKSVETFNNQRNQWKFIAPLNNNRSDHAVIESNDCLFVMGGWDGKEILSSVERLKGLDEKWENIQSMNYTRHSFASVTCQNKIFVIGGFSTNNIKSTTNSVEMFDHSNQNWSEVKSMNIERYGHSACVLQDKIFVVGGKNKKNKYVKEIERYDIIGDEWSIVSQTTDQWFLHSIVAV